MKQVFIPTEKTALKKAVMFLQEKGFNIVTETEKIKAEILIIQTYDQADAKFLQAFPNVKIIVRPAVGIDNIDQEYCKQKNIEIINAPGSNANSVAELTVLQILSLLRNVAQQRDLLMDKQWRSADLIGNEVRGRVLGLLGFGNIARLVAQKLSTWGLAKIIAVDPYVDKINMANVGVEKVDLDELFKQSDIVSIHSPLLPETKGMLNAEKLKLMKADAILINDARGELVNENDLIEALQNHKIRAAALDVFTNEPDIDQRFRQLSNVLLTPHIAAYTHEAIEQMWMQPLRKLI